MNETKPTLRELADSLAGHPALPENARILFSRLVDVVEPLEPQPAAEPAADSQPAA